MKKIPMFFDIENWHWKSKFSWFLTKLCHLYIKDIKKFCNVQFFGKNEACVKCGKNKCQKVNLVIGSDLRCTYNIPFPGNGPNTTKYM